MILLKVLSGIPSRTLPLLATAEAEEDFVNAEAEEGKSNGNIGLTGLTEVTELIEVRQDGADP